jgi:hypothetical protein
LKLYAVALGIICDFVCPLVIRGINLEDIKDSEFNNLGDHPDLVIWKSDLGGR